MPDYSSINCTSVCPYSHYGKDSQERTRNCSEDIYDALTGRQEITTGTLLIH